MPDYLRTTTDDLTRTGLDVDPSPQHALTDGWFSAATNEHDLPHLCLSPRPCAVCAWVVRRKTRKGWLVRRNYGS